MKKVLEIKDLVVDIKEHKLLSIASLQFYEGVNVFLCGTCGSGKTLLLKAIAKQIKYRGRIKRNGGIFVAFHQFQFFSNTLEDELQFLLLEEEQKEFVFQFFSKKDLLKRPNDFSREEKRLLTLVKSFLQKPDLLFMDEIFSFLSDNYKRKFLSYAKFEHITLVHVSKNIEEAIFYDYMIVMNEGRVAIEGKTLQVLQEEKLLKRLGIGLPFSVDLSIQLKLYGLIEGIYLNKEELVKNIWK